MLKEIFNKVKIDFIFFILLLVTSVILTLDDRTLKALYIKNFLLTHGHYVGLLLVTSIAWFVGSAIIYLYSRLIERAEMRESLTYMTSMSKEEEEFLIKAFYNIKEYKFNKHGFIPASGLNFCNVGSNLIYKGVISPQCVDGRLTIGRRGAAGSLSEPSLKFLNEKLMVNAIHNGEFIRK